MPTTELSLETALLHFQEPVLLVKKGLVLYCNLAAERLFSGIRAGAAVPEELSGVLETPDPAPFAAGGVPVSGRTYQVSIEVFGEKVLAVLRPDSQDNALPSPERLAVSLRRETAGLAAALQRLDPREMPEEEKIRKYLSAANQGVYRLLRLANHLEFLDQEDGGDSYHPAPLDLTDFCCGLARQLESLCGAAGYHFSYEMGCASMLTVGDEGLLRRMILSLVSNAMKAVGIGGTLGFRLSLAGGRAVLTVRDNGPGLSEGELHRLFGVQSTLAAGTNPAEGLGLGLEASRRIAGLHGGTVMVEDRPGEGFRAVVAIPVKKPEGMPMHSYKEVYSGGFSPLMVELSDVLPARLFSPEELE